MKLVLKNATFVDWQSLEFKKTNIIVEEGKNGDIEFVDKLEDYEQKFNEILDCNGLLVTKSFALGHHHAYSALSRGMPAPKKSPNNFPEILEYIWWNLDKALDKEMIEASALVTAMACAKNGSTFVIDHHASPNYITNSLDLIAKSFDKVGVNHLLCYEISDRDGLNKAEEGLQHTKAYLQSHQGLVGLHASFTLSNETLKKAAELMHTNNSGIHIHVAEDIADQQITIQRYGKRVAERLNDFGFLQKSKTILVHCLHLSDNERDIIHNSKCYIAQNTESNLNNNVGYFSGKGLGEHIFMGTDGMHSDMLQSMKAAYFVGQANDNMSFTKVYQRFRNTHHYISSNKFEGDTSNNLVVLDYDSPTDINSSNFIGHLIFGINSNHIRHVISNGRLIVKDRKLTQINETEILEFSKKCAKNLWIKMQAS